MQRLIYLLQLHVELVESFESQVHSEILTLHITQIYTIMVPREHDNGLRKFDLRFTGCHISKGCNVPYDMVTKTNPPSKRISEKKKTF